MQWQPSKERKEKPVKGLILVAIVAANRDNDEDKDPKEGFIVEEIAENTSSAAAHWSVTSQSVGFIIIICAALFGGYRLYGDII